MAEHDAADRPRQVAGGERRRKTAISETSGSVGRKYRVGDVAREDAEDDEVVELERAAEAGEQDDPPAGGCDAIRICGH